MLVASVFVLACGPSLGDPGDGTEAGGSSTSEPVAASSSSETGTSSSGPVDASSTGADLAQEFIGEWTCTGYEQPLYVEITGYEPVNQPQGRACLGDGADTPPATWTHCAELSPHPVDVAFWVQLDFGDDLVLNLVLIPDPDSDQLFGRFSPGSETNSVCSRLG